MDIREITFGSARIAEAAGLTHANFRSLLTRGGWRIVGNGRAATANGKGHAFTVVEALGYAVAARLLRLGAPPALAFQLGVEDCIFLDLDMTEPLLRPQGENAAWFVYYPWQERRDASMLLTGRRHFVADFFESTRSSEAVVLDLFGIRNQVFAVLGVEIA